MPTSPPAGGSTVSTHNVLSATHPDAHASDTPVDGDVLTWVAGNSRWESSQPPGAGSGAPTDATYVTTTANGSLSAEVLLSAVVGRGATGSKPAAAVAGRLYFDTTLNRLERDTGSVWEVCEGVFAPDSATYVTLSANGSLSAEAVLGSAVIMRGVFASRPAAATAGLIYMASDTGDAYRDNGATWDLFATTAGGAHAILSSSHSDVDAGDTPADGDVLTWDDGNSEWVAAPAPGAGTGAPTTSNYVTTTTDATLVNEKVLGTVITPTAAYASLPAAAIAGAVHFPSDSFYILRDTSAALVPWGPIYPMTLPVDGDFAWVNQGGASVTATSGGLYLLAPAGAGDNFRIRIKTAPATPYTITAGFVFHLHGVATNQGGLVFRQSSDGKLAAFQFAWTGTSSVGWFIQSAKYTNPTTVSAAYSGTAVGVLPSMMLWLRIADNGSSRITSWSADGQNFHQNHSIGRTDFLTADQVGFYASSNNATWPAALTLVSWKQA
jgi:hypothetical protein